MVVGNSAVMGRLCHFCNSGRWRADMGDGQKVTMLQRTSFKRQAKPERKPMAWPGLQTFAPATRCDGVGVAQPKSPRLENPDLLKLAKGKPCLLHSPICQGGTATTVACHGGGVANGKGMGYKVSDYLTCWGCHACNHYTDAYAFATKEQKQMVFDAGHRLQIFEWQRIAGDMSYTPKERRAVHWALCLLESVPNVAPDQ